VHITGFGVPSAPQADPRDISGGQLEPTLAGFWRSGWTEPVQAYWAGHFARIALSKPFLETLVWEDLSDGLPHMVPHGGIMRNDGTTKPVYDELSAVRKQLGKRSAK
jgi:hypothetical protein